MEKLDIYEEITQLPNCTIVKGKYKDKEFSLKHFLDYSYRIKGEFTDEETKEIVSRWLTGEY